MSTVAILIIVGILAFVAIAIATAGISNWAAVEKARHASRGPISEDLANELRAELAEIKENLASINKMLREVQ